MRPRSVAVVEDDADERFTLRVALEAAGFQVADFSNGFDFLRDTQEVGNRYDAVMLDVQLFGISGLEVAAQVARGGKETRLIFISAAPRALAAAEGDFGERAAYFPKPLDLPALLAILGT